MTAQTRTRQERIIEAVRHGLEGDAAVEFIHQSGHAITTAGIARHLRSMGGRKHVHELLGQGKNNLEILKVCFPDADLTELEREPPQQGELFEETHRRDADVLDYVDTPLYETTRMSIRMPADLYEALRLAARAEGKSQNQLVVDILTSALSKMPTPAQYETDWSA